LHKTIIDIVRLECKPGKEWLQPNSNGTWQIVWEIDVDSDPDEKNVALAWYTPPELQQAPIVPLEIIDYISGAISLLRNGLVLPSLSLLFIALEAALWDALMHKGISRDGEKITYKSVRWDFKVTGGKLLLSIDGSDRKLNELASVVGTYPATGNLSLRKLSTNNSKSVLRIDLDENLTEFFASNDEEERDTYPEKGLSEAVQRARKTEIMQTVPAQLDETIIKLRNNLIHLSVDNKLNPPIPMPDGGQLTEHAELKKELHIANSLVYLVVELINDIYSSPNP
jgi:hypothetical protein